MTPDVLAETELAWGHVIGDDRVKITEIALFSMPPLALFKALDR